MQSQSNHHSKIKNKYDDDDDDDDDILSLKIQTEIDRKIRATSSGNKCWSTIDEINEYFTRCRNNVLIMNNFQNFPKFLCNIIMLVCR